MFGTIIQDAYKENEKDDLAYAINDICNPNDNNGWASAGIYCFWNYQTREILYIGLARNLSERFKQHNGLITIDTKGCKVENINEYFKENEKMGFSIFVQSSHHQPVTSRNIFDLFRKDPELVNVRDYDDEPVKQDYIMTEGILIESYKKVYNTIPPWNKISGSKKGNWQVLLETMRLLECSQAMILLPYLPDTQYGKYLKIQLMNVMNSFYILQDNKCLQQVLLF